MPFSPIVALSSSPRHVGIPDSDTYVLFSVEGTLMYVVYVGHSPVEDFRGVTGVTGGTGGASPFLFFRDVGEKWERGEYSKVISVARRGVGAFPGERPVSEKRGLSCKFWNREEPPKLRESGPPIRSALSFPDLSQSCFPPYARSVPETLGCLPHVSIVHPDDPRIARALYLPDACRRVSDGEESQHPETVKGSVSTYFPSI